LFSSLANAENENETKAKTSICLEGLSTEQLDIPAPLKLNRDAIAYLLQNADHRWLLESLSRIFTRIHAANGDLSELLKAVSEVSGRDLSDVDLSKHPLYRIRRELLSPVVKENYALLLESSWRFELEPDDLAVLAFLLKDVVKNSADAQFITSQGINFDNRGQYTRVQQLLRSEPHRKAAAFILRSGEGRAYFLQAWNAIAIARGRPSIANAKFLRVLSSKDLDEMALKLERGRADLGAAGTFYHYIELFTMPLAEYSLDRIKRNPNLRETQTGHFRFDSLALATEFFADKFQIKASIDNLTEILDLIWFGTSLPISFQRLYGDIINNAQWLVSPLRANYAMRPKNAVAPPMRFNLVDHFVPKESVYIRGRRSDRENTIGEMVANLEGQISPERSFRAFTTYSKRPRSVKDLKADIDYQFWFMREASPSLQKVRLGESVVEWIKEHPSEGRELLDALHMGRAQGKFESGYKKLRRRSPNVDGPIYRLKISNSDRGVMYLHNGVWRFVKVVDKSLLDATIDGIERPQD